MNCFFCDTVIEQGVQYCPNCGSEIMREENQDVVRIPVDFGSDYESMPAPPYSRQGYSVEKPKPEVQASQMIPEPDLSGMYGVMPKIGSPEYAKIREWSWGAFVFTWIWAFVHNLPFWGIMTLILSPLGLNIIPTVLLGMRGREYAWKTGRFVSVEKFMQIQKKWDTAALVFLAVFILLLFIFLALPNG